MNYVSSLLAWTGQKNMIRRSEGEKLAGVWGQEEEEEEEEEETKARSNLRRNSSRL